MLPQANALAHPEGKNVPCCAAAAGLRGEWRGNRHGGLLLSGATGGGRAGAVATEPQHYCFALATFAPPGRIQLAGQTKLRQAAPYTMQGAPHCRHALSQLPPAAAAPSSLGIRCAWSGSPKISWSARWGMLCAGDAGCDRQVGVQLRLQLAHHRLARHTGGRELLPGQGRQEGGKRNPRAAERAVSAPAAASGPGRLAAPRRLPSPSERAGQLYGLPPASRQRSCPATSCRAGYLHGAQGD